MYRHKNVYKYKFWDIYKFICTYVQSWFNMFNVMLNWINSEDEPKKLRDGYPMNTSIDYIFYIVCKQET